MASAILTSAKHGAYLALATVDQAERLGVAGA